MEAHDLEQWKAYFWALAKGESITFPFALAARAGEAKSLTKAQCREIAAKMAYDDRPSCVTGAALIPHSLSIAEDEARMERDRLLASVEYWAHRYAEAQVTIAALTAERNAFADALGWKPVAFVEPAEEPPAPSNPFRDFTRDRRRMGPEGI